jgi:hypothetical protein
MARRIRPNHINRQQTDCDFIQTGEGPADASDMITVIRRQATLSMEIGGDSTGWPTFIHPMQVTWRDVGKVSAMWIACPRPRPAAFVLQRGGTEIWKSHVEAMQIPETASAVQPTGKGGFQASPCRLPRCWRVLFEEQALQYLWHCPGPCCVSFPQRIPAAL